MTTHTTSDLTLLPHTPIQRPRRIWQIAQDVKAHWPKVNYAAEPYLQAMHTLNDTTQHYGAEDAKSILNYFLANAQTWRGEHARRIKAEIKALLEG